MVNLVDNRRPVFDLAIASMLFLQLLVVGLIGWRLTDDRQVAEQQGMNESLAAIELQLETDADRRSATIREQAYADILDAIVTDQTGERGLVEKFADVAAQNRLLHENLEGQLTRVNQTMTERDRFSQKLSTEQIRNNKLDNDLTLARESLDEIKKINDELKLQVDDETATAARSVLWPWTLYTLAGLVLLAAGGLGGFLLTRTIDPADGEFPQLGEEPLPDTENENETDPTESEMAFGSSESESQLSSNQR